MNKQTILGAVSLLVIVLGIVAFALLRPVPARAPVVEDNPMRSGLPPEGVYSEHAKYYDIDAHYASSTPLSGPANAAAVALMARSIQDTILQFNNEGNFDGLTAAEIRTLGLDEGRKESLKIVYLVGSSEHTISYIYTIYSDTLGAHGNTTFRTFTFNTSTGAYLALSDLFVTGSDYLGTLSQIARARLPGIIGDRFDMSMITEGTTPTKENFANFFFDNSYFVILFPPYQVAAYSEGPQTLRIPRSQLANILKSEYR